MAKKNIIGTTDRPRLSVFRSNRYLYAQVIDDGKKHTVASAGKATDPVVLGQEIVAQLKKSKVTSLVFDRSGYRYHGKVKKLAETIREGGLDV